MGPEKKNELKKNRGCWFKSEMFQKKTFQRGILTKIQKVKHFLFFTFSAL